MLLCVKSSIECWLDESCHGISVWTGKGVNECWYPCRPSVLKLAWAWRSCWLASVHNHVVCKNEVAACDWVTMEVAASATNTWNLALFGILCVAYNSICHAHTSTYTPSWAEPNLHAEKPEVGWHHYTWICTTAKFCSPIRLQHLSVQCKRTFKCCVPLQEFCSPIRLQHLSVQWKRTFKCCNLIGLQNSCSGTNPGIVMSPNLPLFRVEVGFCPTSIHHEPYQHTLRLMESSQFIWFAFIDSLSSKLNV